MKTLLINFVLGAVAWVAWKSSDVASSAMLEGFVFPAIFLVTALTLLWRLIRLVFRPAQAGGDTGSNGAIFFDGGGVGFGCGRNTDSGSSADGGGDGGGGGD